MLVVDAGSVDGYGAGERWVDDLVAGVEVLVLPAAMSVGDVSDLDRVEVVEPGFREGEADDHEPARIAVRRRDHGRYRDRPVPPRACDRQVALGADEAVPEGGVGRAVDADDPRGCGLADPLHGQQPNGMPGQVMQWRGGRMRQFTTVSRVGVAGWRPRAPGPPA